MVFKTKPFRQSTFLSSESASVARAELQQDVVNLLSKGASLAKCRNCRVDDNTIRFGESGVFELSFASLIPSRNALLLLIVDTNAQVGTTVNYEVMREGVTAYSGRITVLDRSDLASTRSIRLFSPVNAATTLRLSASRVELPLAFFALLALRQVTNYTLSFPFPSVVSGSVGGMWHLPQLPQRYDVYFLWNSSDDNNATIEYREDGITVATFSTTSRSTISSSISRLWRRDVWMSFRSNNAVVKSLNIDFFAAPLQLRVNSISASYSTTSTSYVKYTPLNLSTVYARIRRIVVSASSNARWYVNVGGNTVLRSEWGISSIDLNPPVEATTVDLYLASADGTNATASIIIIYDEIPARL